MITLFKLLQNKFALYLFGIMLVLIVFLIGIMTYLYQQKETYRYESERWNNNYKAQVIESWKWKTKTGEVVTSSIVERLKKDEIINSKDKDIQKLNEYADKLGKKTKNLEHLLSIKVGVQIDTVLKPEFVFTPGKTEYKEYDTLSLNKDSYIYRIFDSSDSLAHYQVQIGGTFYLYYEKDQKQGKWKVKNILKPREKLPIISVVSDNPILKVDRVKMVVVDKRKKCWLINLFK